MEKRLFTSESVTEGHPDKICDQISDAILDAILEKDKDARVACEVSVSTGLVLVSGEITTSAYVDIQGIVRDTVRDIGYTRGKYGFDSENLAVLVALNEQSPDIAQGVNESLEKRESQDSELDLGAGDQGCIKFDSLIKTNRGLIPINEVKTTDKVLTRYGYNNIKAVRKTGVMSTIKLTTNLGRELELTPDHKVFVDGCEWVEAKDTLNKTVFIDHSSFEPIDNSIEISLIEKIVSIEDNGTYDVYDIEVENNHEFFANGILVHNCMFGFACRETDELMPLPIILSHKLSKGLSDLRKSGTLDYLRPDGKTQVTVEYDENDNPLRVDTIVISTQHDENVSQVTIHEDMIKLINNIVPAHLLDSETKYFINPTGRFVIGGPKGDAGLTGRKIIVDTYGGYARHGGGAFCVDGETEFLTPDGWKSISSYKDGDLVGQWDKGVLSFVEPNDYIVSEAENMYHFYDNSKLNMVLSENHDIVYFDSISNNYLKIKVKDFINLDNFDYSIPVYSLDNLDNFELYSLNQSLIKPFENLSDNMYCFNVPSGMFVAKRDDFIFVTGNSGKDSTKVDRSGAYVARYIAKNIVGANLADKCEVQLSYAIGVSTPISIRVDTFGTSKIEEPLLVSAIRNIFDLRPRGIIEMLDLKRPIYKQTASYGHFGRSDLDLPWERLDKVESLLEFIKNNK